GVELLKASQADVIKKLKSNRACGIFVLGVEIRGPAPGCHSDCSDFSSLFNRISPACSPFFHSGSWERNLLVRFPIVDLNRKNKRPEQRLRASSEIQFLLAGKKTYCRASIRRVMVRFRSLSERRISSILLMECSTVV